MSKILCLFIVTQYRLLTLYIYMNMYTVHSYAFRFGVGIFANGFGIMVSSPKLYYSSTQYMYL